MKQKLFLLSYASDFPGQYLGMAFLVNKETNVLRYCNNILQLARCLNRSQEN